MVLHLLRGHEHARRHRGLAAGSRRRWRGGGADGRDAKGIGALLELGGGGGDADGRGLQGEGLRRGRAARVLRRGVGGSEAVLGGGVRVDVVRVAGWGFPAAVARGEGPGHETGSVGGGLGAELGEVEVGAGLVAQGHGLA